MFSLRCMQPQSIAHLVVDRDCCIAEMTEIGLGLAGLAIMVLPLSSTPIRASATSMRAFDVCRGTRGMTQTLVNR